MKHNIMKSMTQKYNDDEMPNNSRKEGDLPSNYEIVQRLKSGDKATSL